MARIARVVLLGYPHHVTQRSNRRQAVFFADEDYRTYFKMVARACRTAQSDVWAYCPMPNHVHFELVPTDSDGPLAVFSEAHRAYTRRMNLRKGWRGHLWQERFHSGPMDEAHLLAAVRYVELNPVRAGMFERAEDWEWSSTDLHFSPGGHPLSRLDRRTTDSALSADYRLFNLLAHRGSDFTSCSYACSSLKPERWL